MRAIYVPVFDRFFESSIMREDVTVRFVMLALIRLAWRSGANGEVDIDPMMLAGSINIPYPDVEAALNRLMEPDPTSHSPDEDGRRIIPIDPNRPMRGWRLVNWEKYRVLVNRLNDAARKREEYHESKDTSGISESLQKSPAVSKNRENHVTRRYETNTKRDETTKERARFVAPTVDQVRAFLSEKGLSFDADQFVAFYESKGWRVGSAPMRSWRAACVTWSKRDGRDGKAAPAIGRSQPEAPSWMDYPPGSPERLAAMKERK